MCRGARDESQPATPCFARQKVQALGRLWEELSGQMSSIIGHLPEPVSDQAGHGPAATLNR